MRGDRHAQTQVARIEIGDFAAASVGQVIRRGLLREFTGNHIRIDGPGKLDAHVTQRLRAATAIRRKHRQYAFGGNPLQHPGVDRPAARGLRQLDLRAIRQDGQAKQLTVAVLAFDHRCGKRASRAEILSLNLSDQLAVGQGAGAARENLVHRVRQQAVRFAVRSVQWKQLFNGRFGRLCGIDRDDGRSVEHKFGRSRAAGSLIAASNSRSRRLPPGLVEYLGGNENTGWNLSDTFADAASHGSGVARIDDDCHRCPALFDLAEPGTQLIVDDRVGDLADTAIPGFDVSRQEQFVQAVRLGIVGRRIQIGLLTAVAGEKDHDLLARLSLAPETAKLALDVGSCRPEDWLAGGLGEDHHALGREAEPLAEKVSHQCHVVRRTLQMQRWFEVIVLGATDQQRAAMNGRVVRRSCSYHDRPPQQRRGEDDGHDLERNSHGLPQVLPDIRTIEPHRTGAPITVLIVVDRSAIQRWFAERTTTIFLAPVLISN